MRHGTLYMTMTHSVCRDFFFLFLSSSSSSSGKILFDKCCSILIKLRDAAEFTSVGAAVFCRWERRRTAAAKKNRSSSAV